MTDPFGSATSSSRSPDPTDDFGRITKNINSINLAVRELEKMVNEIGTSKDGKKLRTDLKQKRDDTVKVRMETKSLLDKEVNQNEKVKRDRLAKQFNDALSAYEKIAQISVRKEREIITILEEGLTERSDLSVPAEKRSNTLSRLKEINFEDVNEKIIQEQNADVFQIEKDLEQLQDCFVDFSEELNRQAQDLQQADQNLEKGKLEVRDGRKILEETSILATAIRWKQFIIALIIIIVIIIIIVAATCGSHKC